MYIIRQIEKEVEKFITDRKVIIILGPRQVGKTTLVEKIIRHKGGLLLNLDIEVDSARLTAIRSLPPLDAMQALGNPPILAIDEAQRLEDIGILAKAWYDAGVTTKILLLGSSSLDLLGQTAEPLTGRNHKIFLTPLNFTEILKIQSWYTPQLTPAMVKMHFANQLQSLLLLQMVYGNYPEAVTVADKERYLLNLVSDYLFKDVLQLGLIRSPEQIRKLLTLLAYQAGSEISVNELASVTGLSRETVERYLELLEKTFVIFRLHAFSTNQRKEIAKSTKVFFWDTGVRNALLKDFSLSQYRADIGGLFENYVIAEIAKQNLSAGERASLYFWRKVDGGEVDLIVKGAKLFKAYEMKWTKSKPTAASKSFTNLYPISIETFTRETVFDLLLQDLFNPDL